jgi:hypothetical protein
MAGFAPSAEALLTVKNFAAIAKKPLQIIHFRVFHFAFNCCISETAFCRRAR